jgi:SAM-dependent methyltransferase
MADLFFEEPRLARIYDDLDPDRSDLEVYADMVAEFGARTVLDIGCGTGTFACLLSDRGIDVVAVDPAQASIEVARSKRRAGRVRWLHGDATMLPPLSVDMAFMTGNVAQVFLTDSEWMATLRGTRAALRPGGRLVFETRDPARRAWEEWTPEKTWVRSEIAGVDVVESWNEVTEVRGDLVTFRWKVAFEADGAIYESESTLRFRGREAVEPSLASAGFDLEEVRDAPDRPERELVFIARRSGTLN